LGRVVRGRAANPRWIQGVMRHGYRGAAEIAATVDYLFAFAATARAVDDSHFELLYDAYLGDAAVQEFMAAHNPAALAETRSRFREAIERGLWRPKRNSIRDQLLSVIPAKAGTQSVIPAKAGTQGTGPPSLALDPCLREGDEGGSGAR
jgi:cobaltochelatase CobN